MTEKAATKEEKLKALALTMPQWDDLMIDEFRKDPEFARLAIADELKEYAETGDIRYLLSTLKQVAAARGMANIAKDAGLNRTTLYEVLNGSDPRVGTLNKILQALGFRMLFVSVDSTKRQSSSAKTTSKKTAATRDKNRNKKLQLV